MDKHPVDYEDDLDDIDFNNYKGFFYQDKAEQRYQDEVTGAHFNYIDMCHRLKAIQNSRHDQPAEDLAADNRVDTLKELASLLDPIPSKQSRNAAQTLPQQGFVTGICRRPEPAMAKLFSSNEDVGKRCDRIKIVEDPRKYRDSITRIFKLQLPKQTTAKDGKQRPSEKKSAARPVPSKKKRAIKEL